MSIMPKAKINTTDLNTFYNGFSGGRDIVLEGVTMKGTLNDFVIPQGKIILSKYTYRR